MINLAENLLSATSLNASLVCDTDQCLSFIIVFLNLLTVFYLVYSSYRKITKVTRLFGYIWSCFIMVVSVIVLIIHTCVFTIGGTIFTGMAIMSVLSMIFDSKKVDHSDKDVETRRKDIGCYVIFPTTDNNFVFGLHDKRDQLLAMSRYKYPTIDDAKEAINYVRKIGENSEFEDLTKNWVIDAKHPKFRMFSKKQKYFFELAVSKDFVPLKSPAIDEEIVCSRMVKDAIKCITTSILYVSIAKKDIKIGKKFLSSTDKDTSVALMSATDIEEDSSAKSLSESLREMENIKTTSNVNKQTLYEYLSATYGDDVILNRRENRTKTGLPLADTYYAYQSKIDDGREMRKEVCFAYVYEKSGACLILAKLDSFYAKSLINSGKPVVPSKFPKSKTRNWYSIIVNDSFTENEIHTILGNAKSYSEK